MAENKVWVPFENEGQEENPFHFDLARESMKNAVRLEWTQTPGWADSPIRPESVERVERRLRVMLEDLLGEFRDDVERQRQRDGY